MKPYRNLVEVPVEVDQAASWYEARERGWGVQFVVAVETAMERICEAPRAWPLWPRVPAELGIRRYTMRRFPFLIAFSEEPSEIVVFAVAHSKRWPLYWLARAGLGSASLR